MADTQDRIPREAIEAADERMENFTPSKRWDAGGRVEKTEAVVDAAYPLILRAVCQELAAALRNAPDNQVPAVEPFRARLALDHAAEFVESFGASPGGE